MLYGKKNEISYLKVLQNHQGSQDSSSLYSAEKESPWT